MNIIVAVKRVIDYEVEIQVNAEDNDVVKTGVPMSMNPFDEVALEEAIRLKESGIAERVLVVTVGDNDCQSVLKSALAMGADEALLVETDNAIEPLVVAKVMAKLAVEESADLLFFGKQAIDNDANQTGQMTAALLNCGQAVFVASLSVDTQNRTVEAVRDTDYGTETLELALPAVITSALRLNEPRFVGLPQLMQAKTKPITTRQLSDFEIANSDKRLHVVSVRHPEKRPAVEMLDSAEKLAEIIQQNSNH